MRRIVIVLVLAHGLARAQVPLRSDTPPAEPSSPAPDAPLPDAPPSDTRSGTSAPPVERVAAPAPAPIVVPPPPPREPVAERRRPNVALLSSGVTLLVLGYVADIGFTYGYDHHPASTSLIPVVGPWIQLHQRYGLDGPPINTGSADADARATQTVDSANRTIRGLAYTGEIATGLMQAAGLALAIAGAITRGKARRTSDVSGRSYVSRPAPLQANGMYLLEF